MGRITWEAGRYASQVGYIHGETKGYKAKIELFRIDYSSSREDIRAGTPYLVQHRLPFRGVERKFPTVKDAQAHAERYLLHAMDMMGFVPKQDVETLKEQHAKELAEARLEVEK